jgi:hypothetical protein
VLIYIKILLEFNGIKSSKQKSPPKHFVLGGFFIVWGIKKLSCSLFNAVGRLFLRSVGFKP